jgi:hypothetical protein
MARRRSSSAHSCVGHTGYRGPHPGRPAPGGAARTVARPVPRPGRGGRGSRESHRLPSSVAAEAPVPGSGQLRIRPWLRGARTERRPPRPTPAGLLLVFTARRTAPRPRTGRSCPQACCLSATGAAGSTHSSTAPGRRGLYGAGTPTPAPWTGGRFSRSPSSWPSGSTGGSDASSISRPWSAIPTRGSGAVRRTRSTHSGKRRWQTRRADCAALTSRRSRWPCGRRRSRWRLRR